MRLRKGQQGLTYYMPTFGVEGSRLSVDIDGYNGYRIDLILGLDLNETLSQLHDAWSIDRVGRRNPCNTAHKRPMPCGAIFVPALWWEGEDIRLFGARITPPVPCAGFEPPAASRAVESLSGGVLKRQTRRL